MSYNKVNIEVTSRSLTDFIKAVFALMKFRLSLTVVFSAAFGYALGFQSNFNLTHFIVVLIAGFAITVSSNIINQIIEIHSDKLMKRTKNRPLPSGTISVNEAIVLAFIFGAFSIFMFVTYINISAALLSLLSLVLYAFAYTPMKRIHPIAVFIGAIPGALPPMIGWVAATNSFGWQPGILFAIQFIWQFPHFWAIAWVLDDDYSKAGIKLLPGTGKDIKTALQIMIYTVMLIPIGFVPYLMGMTGFVSAIIVTVCGVLFTAQTMHLMKKCNEKAALQIMFGSFLYLPIVQIAFVLDKVV